MLSHKRILIADDHALFRRGLTLVLRQLFEGIQVFEARDVDEALALIEREVTPDLVLLDLAMPGMEQFFGLTAIRERLPAVPVVMLSAVTQSEDILEAMKRGARGYVLKSASDQVLKHGLSLVMSGETYFPSHILAERSEQLRSLTRGAGVANPADNPLDSLTERQHDVLALLMEGLSNKEIARHLGLMESTIKASVKVILKKLDAANRTQAAMIGSAMGLDQGAARREGV